MRSVALWDRVIRLIISFDDSIVQAITSLVGETDEGFPAIALRNRLSAFPKNALLR